MAKQLLVKTPTLCGVCMQAVVLLASDHYHLLIEISPKGSRQPHCCPTGAIDAWRRRERQRYGSILDRIDRGNRHAPAEPKTQSQINHAGWLTHKGSSLGTHFNSIEEALILGALHPRSCLAKLIEEQAETVRRLALAGLLAIRKATEESA